MQTKTGHSKSKRFVGRQASTHMHEGTLHFAQKTKISGLKVGHGSREDVEKKRYLEVEQAHV